MKDDELPKLHKALVNKIVGHGEVSVDQLLANPFNYRLHPHQQQAALAGAIDEIGFIRSLTVNQRNGHVVDGHLRVTLAARSGVKSLPVEFVDLTDEEEAEALATIDPIGAMAAHDRQKLDELLRNIHSSSSAVQQMLADLAENAGLYPQGDEIDFDQFKAPDEEGGNIVYRVVIDGLSKDKAYELADTIAGARVEQYRE